MLPHYLAAAAIAAALAVPGTYLGIAGLWFLFTYLIGMSIVFYAVNTLNLLQIYDLEVSFPTTEDEFYSCMLSIAAPLAAFVVLYGHGMYAALLGLPWIAMNTASQWTIYREAMDEDDDESED